MEEFARAVRHALQGLPATYAVLARSCGRLRPFDEPSGKGVREHPREGICPRRAPCSPGVARAVRHDRRSQLTNEILSADMASV